MLAMISITLLSSGLRLALPYCILKWLCRWDFQLMSCLLRWSLKSRD